ncbi:MULTISPECIES: hypothetical protein [unclassified Pseudodesulfovibrio]|uniref:hypothetical protein n=1 Tax=unclassified Pseudodesulfovibrio TaxID=2661612 RepID=UPI000FEBD285|nr:MULTISPECIES: hypothetical protein [unclassified Pseudodesulfovibrio]MCJ2165781.1 hypothetical protein [Pseudodesulfovibrio sp. S3-i]RWU02782.1 hypothetical protein DWB63_14715 [Pseudodesulfovibrio sp. S3]
MTDDTIIDVQHVTCGLVPLMQTHLGGTEPEVETVSFKIRQGIQTELWNSFGTGSEWRLTDISSDLFFDVATFIRVEQSELDPLGLMEF